MSEDVADSTDVRSALSQVETGKGLLFWGRIQENSWWERAVSVPNLILKQNLFAQVELQAS